MRPKTTNGNGRSVASTTATPSSSSSVYAVDPQRDAEDAASEQLLERAAAPTATRRSTVGGHPAAKKVTTDHVGEGEAAKKDANKVTTATCVGCNGETKWVDHR